MVIVNILTQGKIISGTAKAFIGLNTPETLITSKDNPLIYEENGELPPYDEISSIPPGIITMWSGSSDAIPDGWHLCDGTNGTPDLRDRFVLGTGNSYAVGATGGNATVTLNVNNLPSHNHNFSGTAASAGSHTHSHSLSAASSGSHTHTISNMDLSRETSGGGTDAYGRDSWGSTKTSSDGAHTHKISGSIKSGGSHTHTLSGNISNTGSGEAFDIMPPYYALCFIMKL